MTAVKTADPKRRTREIAAIDRRSARELFVNLTLRELRGRYRRTVLGNTWSLVNPIASMVIYTAVFSVLLRIEPDRGDPSGLHVFALWLMCGLLAWNFLSGGFSAALGSLVGNANLLTKVYFPRWVVVASAVAATAVTFAIEMAVLAVALVIFGANIFPLLPFALLIMVLLVLFAFGAGLAFSVLNVYFRDTQHFVAIGLQMWFYLTPIVYPIAYVEEQQRRLEASGDNIPLVTLFKLNPMEHFVSALRNTLYDNRLPTLLDLGVCFGVAVVSMAIGWSVFQRYSARIVEEL